MLWSPRVVIRSAGEAVGTPSGGDLRSVMDGDRGVLHVW